MATWVKFRSALHHNYLVLVDLDKVFVFFDNTKDNIVSMRAGDETFNIEQKKDAEAYNKALEYMRQIEQ